ncbi:MAG: DUF2804 domain-containing protein [Promethearchaeota archaeon]
MTQNNDEIVKEVNLFDDNGNLNVHGWARKPIINYNKEKIRSSWFRTKEWDNYVINHEDYNFSVTIADVGYLGLISIELMDYKEQKVYSGGHQKFFTKGSWNLPRSSTKGDIEFHTEDFDLKILRLPDKRIISVDYPNFNDQGLKADITLYQDPNKDSIVKVNKYKKKKLFYYSDKVIGMPTSGEVKFGNKKYTFNEENSYARLDWGRGVWPYKINWYWGAAAGKTDDGHEIWFSHGYSYDDPGFHDKNMVGYDQIGHKFGPIKFEVPENPKDTWKFISEDGKFDLEMKPIFFHPSKMDFVIFKSSSILVFGKYSGKIILDDDTEIKVNDFIGHAESIKWKW